MDWLVRAQDGVTIFLGVVIEATPFLLLGVLVSQGLALALGDRTIGWLPRGRLASLTALAGLGAFFPVCEGGNVPVARRLLARGVPAAAAAVFLLSAPAFNPVVALSTYAAFQAEPAIVAYRLGLTFAVAVGVGLLLSFHPRPSELVRRPRAAYAREPATGAPPASPGGGARRFARALRSAGSRCPPTSTSGSSSGAGPARRSSSWEHAAVGWAPPTSCGSRPQRRPSSPSARGPAASIPPPRSSPRP